MKKFNKKKARVVVREMLGKEQFGRMAKLLNAALNDQDNQPLQFGIPENSKDITDKIYYVIGRSGEIYEQNVETIDKIFDDVGMA